MNKKKNQTEQNVNQATEEQVNELNTEQIQEEQKVEKTEEAEVESAEGPSVEEKLAEMEDAHLRLRAEFENYRKRTMKEKADLLKSASERVLVEILPLVDDFERGIQASAKAEDIDAVREGLSLIYDKFVAFLNSQGVKAIDAIGQDFNTDFHEAITMIPAPTEDMKGKVIDCTKKGYMLSDKVIRYSQVVVGE
ncbi:MAG: nucleotide exchange factor GrpE [Paludibacteraceae bacterium]|nr:nucleotide exchange factor GrpE [Paludibacteraceae bacterium]